MIPILPNSSRTIVTILELSEVYDRLRSATTKQALTQNSISARKIAFVGTIQPDRFTISLKVTRPNNFLPVVRGRLESTHSGCLIFMKLGLFPSTRTYLIFWLLFVLVAGLIVSRQYESPLLLAAPLLLDLIILWIAWTNFNMQLRFTMRALDEVLEA